MGGSKKHVKPTGNNSDDGHYNNSNNSNNNNNNNNNSNNHNHSKNNHSNSIKIRTSQQRLQEDNSSWVKERNQDMCQRFFGDPLFSNFNVTLLFLLATFLPMLVWIPRFVGDYRRLREIQLIEDERRLRMEQSRQDLQNRRSLEAGLIDYGFTTFPDKQEAQMLYNFRDIDKLNSIIQQFETTPSSHNFNMINDVSSYLQPGKPTVLPTLCPDGVTIGFNNWFTLREAILEANAIAAEDFLRWNKFLVLSAKNDSLEPPIFKSPEPFVICPFVTLHQKSFSRKLLRFSFVAQLFSFFPFHNFFYQTSPALHAGHYSLGSSSGPKNKLPSIFINAEDIIVECNQCIVDMPGTHFSFGPHAKNVLIKGITFKSATTSSVTFHHHGAVAAFEDCCWLHNSGGTVNMNNNALLNANDKMNNVGSTMVTGAVADLNSSSTVTFYRCMIDDRWQNPRKVNVGAGLANVPGMIPPGGHNSPANVAGNTWGTTTYSIILRP